MNLGNALIVEQQIPQLTLYAGIAIVKKYLTLLFFIGIAFFGFKQALDLRVSKVEVTDNFSFFSTCKEKKELDYLFKSLVFYDSGGYTLLGNKPMSFQFVLKPIFKLDLIYLLEAFSPSNLRKYKAWNTWQKYSSLFPRHDFLIWSEPSPWNKDVEIILLAKRSSLNRVVKENIDDFRNVTGNERFDFQDLLREIENRSLFKGLLANDGLIGTLLGYGSQNAWLFWERAQRRDIFLSGSFTEENQQLFSNKRAAFHFAFGWPSVEMEEVLMYPSFLVDKDSEETKTLKKNYSETREKILEFYRGRDFLKATLEMFL